MADQRRLRFTSAAPTGPWGDAQVAIHNALARNGVDSELRREAEMDRGQAPASAIDEAGMLLVDSGRADIGVNFREQVDWAFRALAHHQGYRHRNLRALARLVQPQYVGIAATRDSGITSLEDVASQRRPIR